MEELFLFYEKITSQELLDMMYCFSFIKKKQKIKI